MTLCVKTQKAKQFCKFYITNANTITPKGVNPDSGLLITNYEHALGYKKIHLQFYITHYILYILLVEYMLFIKIYFSTFHNAPAPLLLNYNYNFGFLNSFVTRLIYGLFLNKSFTFFFITFGTFLFLTSFTNDIFAHSFLIVKIFCYTLLNTLCVYILNYSLDKIIVYQLKFHQIVIPKVLSLYNNKSTNPLKKGFFRFLFLFIEALLLLRSFFKKEHPIVFLVTSLLLVSLFFYFNYSTITLSFIFILQGIYMLQLDAMAQSFSEYLLENPNATVTIAFKTFLVKQFNANFVIIRKVAGRAFGSIFFGKSGLTPTGKSAVFIGACTAGASFYNSYRDRVQREDHFNRGQEFSATEAEKQRSHDKEKWAEAEKQRSHDREKWARENAQQKKSSSWWKRN